jgi:CubicO group peptidase (beta-lactamase class C family)
MRSFRLLTALLASLGGVSLAGPPVEMPEAFTYATPESQGISSEALDELTGIVDGYVEQDTIVGAELVIIKNRNVILHEIFGYRDREEEIPWAKNTICNVRSMSKCLTGAAAQLLIDEGKLGLDDPVAKYLPSFDNKRSRAITVRHLLTHRSGLPLTMLTLSYREHESLRAIADQAGERGPSFVPDSAFQYSDTGSDVLGAVIEAASGEPLQVFFRSRLIMPLGMQDTFIYNDSDDPRRDRIASLYVGAQRNWTRFWTPNDAVFYPFAAGSQSIYSTPLDYAKFLAMWMDGGKVCCRQLLSPEAINRTLTPVSDMPIPTGFPGTKVRYGQMAILWVDAATGEDAGPEAFGHSGSDGTWACAWPQQDLIVLYFTQSRGQATGWRLQAAIDRLLIHPGEEIVQTAGTEVPERFKPYLGVYVANFANFRDEEITVKVHNGRLALDVPSQIVFELEEPDGKGLWHLVISYDIAVSFGRDEDGEVNLLRFHQAGMEFEAPRKGSALEAEIARTLAAGIDEAEAARYVGRYFHPERNAEIEVAFKDSRLHIVAPEASYELVPPDEQGRWPLRAAPGILMTFQTDETGKVISMTRTIRGTALVMPRVDAP